MPFTNEEKARLPKWAQQKLSDLEAELRQAVKAKIDIFDSNKDAIYFCGVGLDHVPLPPHVESLRVQCEAGRFDLVWANSAKELRLYADSRLVVRPRSMNTILLQEETF